MKYNYIINEKNNNIFVKLEGRMCGRIFFSALGEIIENLSYKPKMNFLIDCTSLKAYYAHYETFQKFINKITTFKSLSGSIISCIVNDGILMGYIDMMSEDLKESGIDLAGFHLACKASEYLGIDCNMNDICSKMKELRFTCTEHGCRINCRKKKFQNKLIIHFQH